MDTDAPRITDSFRSRGQPARASLLPTALSYLASPDANDFSPTARWLDMDLTLPD